MYIRTKVNTYIARAQCRRRLHRRRLRLRPATNQYEVIGACAAAAARDSHTNTDTTHTPHIIHRRQCCPLAHAEHDANTIVIIVVDGVVVFTADVFVGALVAPARVRARCLCDGRSDAEVWARRLIQFQLVSGTRW